jgi:uncharacterized membrane protein
LFLAGTAVALSAGRRADRGGRTGIDRDLLVRGTLLIAFDAVYMTQLAGQTLLLQVLYAIGLSMILMIPLRRLGAGVLASLGACWFVVGEWVTGQFWEPPAPPPALATRVLLAPYHGESVTILYPVVPWLALMAIGYAFGMWLDHRRQQPPPVRALLTASALCALVFTVVRGFNDYGNMFLPRADAYGQTALFFYLLHFLVLGALAMGTGSFGEAGLLESYLATLVALAVMYPLCRLFRGYKRGHPRSLARYL